MLDRLVYSNLEPLVALATAAAVTRKVRLAATVLLAPLRSNYALFVKQLASIDDLSDGRLVVGMGVGARADDYDVSRLPYGSRGTLLDEQLDRVIDLLAAARIKDREAVGPALPEGHPEILVGGASRAAFRRLGQYARGWISGRAGLPMFIKGAPLARDAWRAAGRGGDPHLAALAYFSLGSNARERADAYLGDYYGFDAVAARDARRSVADTAGRVRHVVEQFAGVGCDELIFFPCDPDPDQVYELADAVGLD